MKKNLFAFHKLAAVVLTLFSLGASAQTLEWRLTNKVYNAADPDAGGPATSSTQFTLQIHTVAGSVTNVNAISTGYSYNSLDAMVPTVPGCATVTSPANITLSPTFAGAGFSLNINQCNNFVQNSGPRTFDRRASGTIDGGVITLTNTWVDVFTVTLWNLRATPPEGGWVVINSGAGGSPAAFTTYAVADDQANEYVVNSTTYVAPLALTSAVLPVTFGTFDVDCGDKGAILKWTTATEINNSHFEIQKNTGAGWVTIGQIAGAGNSNEVRRYQFIDLEGGNNVTYQIKQVDFDGRSSLSAQRNRSCTGRQVNVVLYPVPTNNLLNVVIRTDQQIRTELQVFDMSGRIVKRQAVVLNTGTNNLTFDVTNLAVGEYILSSSDKNVQLNKKFTIAR